MTDEQLAEIRETLSRYPDKMFCEAGEAHELPASEGRKPYPTPKQCKCGADRCGFERMRRANRDRA